MKIIKFIVKENIKEGYSLREQLLDALGVGAFIVLFLMVM